MPIHIEHSILKPPQINVNGGERGLLVNIEPQKIHCLSVVAVQMGLVG
ncbi:MAG: hypothetical protein LWW74_07385 [Burkholderiales bacterium]|nr:hypothetical protein [Burkholderiales bacterium]MCE1176283.1 hypothetical protein [Burkholderiales bacterium]